MSYTQLLIRIDQESACKVRHWAKKKAVEFGRFSLNAWLVEQVKNGMSKEGI